MLTKRIIACLDIDNGRVVKGVNFVGIRDAGDPVELAQRYDAQGVDELVFLDITASSDDRAVLIDCVSQVAACVFIPLTVGGGIRTVADMRAVLCAGADKVAINSAAIHTPELITAGANQFGAQCMVVAIDVKQNDAGEWIVYTHGGRRATALNALDWAVEAVARGAGELLITSMDHDGTKSGYASDLMAQIRSRVRVPIIASGGAGTAQHVADVLPHCDAALLASLLHDQILTVQEIKQTVDAAGLPVRHVSV